jgi:general secretion pathway protein F
MRFEIKGYRHQDGVIALSLEAADYNEARSIAGDRGMDILSIRQQWHLSPQRQRKDPAFDLLLFSQELRSLLDAGLSLIEALGALSRKESASHKGSLVNALIRQLREGRSFSAALREFPAAFPPLYVALAAASEQTGNLGSGLGRFIDYRRQADVARKRVVSAAIYPTFLVGAGSLVIVFLMTYVVPRFGRIYEDFGKDLPFMSRLLMQWGRLIDAYGPYLLVAGLAVLSSLVYLFRRTAARQAVLQRLLALKALRGLRERIQTYALSRFFRTLGLLQQEGIPIVTALGLARELLGEDGRLALDRVVLDIRAGVSLSSSMEAQGLAPPVANELLRVGEKTGDIGEKMTRIADFYDEEIAQWTEWFVRLFEPLLMLTIGLFIAFIVVLLYMPIFELAGGL